MVSGSLQGGYTTDRLQEVGGKFGLCASYPDHLLLLYLHQQPSHWTCLQTTDVLVLYVFHTRDGTFHIVWM